MADLGADTLEIQRAGGWKSQSTVQIYVGQSKVQKLKLANRFINNQNQTTNNSPSSIHNNQFQNQTHPQNVNVNLHLGSININNSNSNNSSSTFNITLPIPNFFRDEIQNRPQSIKDPESKMNDDENNE